MNILKTTLSVVRYIDAKILLDLSIPCIREILDRNRAAIIADFERAIAKALK